MGILSVFDPNYADLSRISNNNLYVSRIMHKAEIEVTEEGTVASAVTGEFFLKKYLFIIYLVYNIFFCIMVILPRASLIKNYRYKRTLQTS